MTLLNERFAEVGPLAAMEAQLARAAVAARGRLHADDETALRYALSLSRCWNVRAPDGHDVAVAEHLRPLRERVLQVLWPLLDPQRPRLAEPHELLPAARAVLAATRAALAAIEAGLGHRLPFERLDSEVRERHHLLRLCDGGVVDNVPVRTAWQHVQRSGLPGSGSRNIVLFALDGFAPRLMTPLWLPLQSVAAPAVARNRPYAHLYKSFRKTLSPLALLPSQRSLDAIVRSAKEELLVELPLLQRLLAPIDAVVGSRG